MSTGVVPIYRRSHVGKAITKLPDMGTTHFFRFNSFSESVDSNQLITHNGFTTLDSNQLAIQMNF